MVVLVLVKVSVDVDVVELVEVVEVLDVVVVDSVSSCRNLMAKTRLQNPIAKRILCVKLQTWQTTCCQRHVSILWGRECSTSANLAIHSSGLGICKRQTHERMHQKTRRETNGRKG